MIFQNYNPVVGILYNFFLFLMLGILHYGKEALPCIQDEWDTLRRLASKYVNAILHLDWL